MESTCINIKSVRTPRVRCKNPATHGEYCGIHYKSPRPWIACTPTKIINKKKKKRKIEDNELDSKNKIIKWWRVFRGNYLFKTRGPAFYVRDISTNDTDFFSCDNVKDISSPMFFSYKCDDSHVYSFDLRSIYSLITNGRNNNSSIDNPYNRIPIPSKIIEKVDKLAKLLLAHGVSVHWAPLKPPTPEQQFRMRVVDVFHTIDELNYYSSPDWFIRLDARGHRRFYTELHDIWTHRAGLTLTQKTAMIPGFHTKLFRSAPWTLRDVSPETVAKLNLSTIKLFIESANDRSDRILGAMYVVTALTLVSSEARNAYPWLYETVEPTNTNLFPDAIINNTPIGLVLINEFIQAHIPTLQLPPTIE
jgi:hypothetical protein